MSGQGDWHTLATGYRNTRQVQAKRTLRAEVDMVALYAVERARHMDQLVKPGGHIGAAAVAGQHIMGRGLVRHARLLFRQPSCPDMGGRFRFVLIAGQSAKGGV
jgi:hypothetical protein